MSKLRELRGNFRKPYKITAFHPTSTIIHESFLINHYIIKSYDSTSQKRTKTDFYPNINKIYISSQIFTQPSQPKFVETLYTHKQQHYPTLPNLKILFLLLYAEPTTHTHT